MQFWLSQRQPLAVHGADLRDTSCIPSFRLTRGEVGQIIQGEGNPDDVVACFTNCGRYEYPKTPDADCDPNTDERCKNWLASCCYAPQGDPNHVYGGDCTNDSECHQGAGCWNDGSQPCTMRSDCSSGFSCLDGVCAKPFCACRAFLKNDDCSADVCTHPYSSHDRASQPPFGLCTDVTSDETACIGDDTVHAVFPGGYTWPNDPQTYVSDARAYRIIFAPGGTSVPITKAEPVPACSSLPDPPYGYAAQRLNCSGEINAGAIFAGAAVSRDCTKDTDCPIIPGSNPPSRFSCDTESNRCATWACEISPGGPVTTGDILCSWSAGDQTPTPTPTRRLGEPPPTQTGGPMATRIPGAEDDGCAINPNDGSSSGGILLALVAAAGALLRTRRRIPH